jgi:lipoate-protein ligase A
MEKCTGHGRRHNGLAVQTGEIAGTLTDGNSVNDRRRDKNLLLNKQDEERLMNIRVLEMGDLPYYQSQTIYHMLAYGFNETSMNTISLCSPREPYISVGYFQETAKEVDVEFCKNYGIPIIRREVGGGAVLLDNDQLFFHFVFHKKDVPAKVVDIYRKFLQPAIAAYRRMGIEAHYKPINDLVVGHKKIGGTGAAEIGQAVVVVGSFMFDFNHALMSKVLKIADEKMRDKVLRNISEYVTTMRREHPAPPDKKKVTAMFLESVREELGTHMVHSQLTDEEQRAMKTLDARFKSDDWLYHWSRKRELPKKVKIMAGLNIVEAVHKSPGGLIRVMAEIQEQRIKDISFSGDFAFTKDFTAFLENSLRGLALKPDLLRASVATLYNQNAIDAPGTGPDDWVTAVMKIKEVLKD